MLSQQPCDHEVVQAVCGTFNDCQCGIEAGLKGGQSPDQHNSKAPTYAWQRNSDQSEDKHRVRKYCDTISQDQQLSSCQVASTLTGTLALALTHSRVTLLTYQPGDRSPAVLAGKHACHASVFLRWHLQPCSPCRPDPVLLAHCAYCASLMASHVLLHRG